MTTVQPIYYTHRTAEWHAFARDLGLVAAFEPSPDWAEFDGDGILAIHHAEEKSALAGTTQLHVLVDDLDAVETALRATGTAVSRGELEGVGAVVTATTASGIEVSASAGRRAAGGPMRVQPLWYRESSDEPVRVLRALGLRERLRSDSGDWIDFEGDGGGLAAFHREAREAMTLSFEFTGDLDELAARLVAAGHEPSIIDEAYNRTLLVRTPDDWTLWINGAITDLYGYQRVG